MEKFEKLILIQFSPLIIAAVLGYAWILYSEPLITLKITLFFLVAAAVIGWLCYWGKKADDELWGKDK